jgi:hypothetical protein
MVDCSPIFAALSRLGNAAKPPEVLQALDAEVE